jgi:hypothetical protein
MRGADLLAPREIETLRAYLVSLFHQAVLPPKRGTGIDWRAIARASQVNEETMVAAANAFRPGLAALEREIRKGPHRAADRLSATPPGPGPGRPPAPTLSIPPPLLKVAAIAHDVAADAFADFHVELDRHMRAHGDTPTALAREARVGGLRIEGSTLRMWRRGIKAPQHKESHDVLAWLERRWGLPEGHFRPLLPNASFSTKGQDIEGVGSAERRRLAWHLPDDFHLRPHREREQILEWVQRVVVSGATDYRRYQSAAMKHRFALQFHGLVSTPDRGTRRSTRPQASPPASLAAEMAELIAFKTRSLAPRGYTRRGVWGPDTAAQKLEHFGLFFGALIASPTGPVRGFGAPVDTLTCGLFVFPAVWDWYLDWRERRRGFFTAWEANMLVIGSALTNPETGWIAQTPSLADRLRPIDGLVSIADIEEARQDWPGACARLHRFALARTKEIERVARVHHDPFEPILPVLEAESPVAEYRKIADEVLRWAPCPRRYPKAAAEATRAYLMLRLGLHLGFRQRNLRQLLFCPPGRTPRSERALSDAKRGELRWNDREQGWEVFVPACAFKNAGSSFFGGRPFRLLLPDFHGLSHKVLHYLEAQRGLLLGPAEDPGTFFIKTTKAKSVRASYDQTTFYEAWRWIIQRHGILNPYTGRGAIAGLLPHGPHSVRDVIATHVLKRTGSYEQASYAIQDTPETVAAHYGRFLPQDKAAMAAEILNRAWLEPASP